MFIEYEQAPLMKNFLSASLEWWSSASRRRTKCLTFKEQVLAGLLFDLKNIFIIIITS
jgi:hypothetical protein